MNEPIDFEQLLRKYMKLVESENEGETFVRYCQEGIFPHFTQDEVDYLDKLNSEL